MSTEDVLVRVVRELSAARDLSGVTAAVRRAARELTGADGATFVLREGELCRYVDEDAIAPLWKGRRFPVSSCISGWTMTHGQAAVIEDVTRDPRIPQAEYEATFVRSLVMVPIRSADPLGAIGVYWARVRRADAQEVARVQALADATAVAMENVRARDEARRWRGLLAEASDSVWTVDPTVGTGADGVTRWWAGLTGRPVESYGSTDSWLQDVLPEDRDATAAAWHASLTDGVPYRARYRIRASDGSVRHMLARAAAVRRPDGTHEMVGMMSDVTAEREAEQAAQLLEEARLRLELACQASSVGFWEWDEADGSWHATAECARQLGYEPGEVADSLAWWRRRMPAGERAGTLRRFLDHARVPRQPFEQEIRLRHRDGSDRWFLCRASGVQAEGAAHRRLVGCQVDITELQQAQQDRERLHRQVEEERRVLRQLSRRLLTAQDEERRRISRDLHDDLAQALTAVKLSLSGLRPGLPADAHASAIEGALATLDHSIRQTRDLSLRLHPPMLDILGLGPTLRWFLGERLRGASLVAHVSIAVSDARFPAPVESACFRLVQEAVTNALRHSGAREVTVHVEEAADALLVSVRDDGRGFDPADAWSRTAAGGSAGLAGMQERVALAGGSFEVASRPGEGACIGARLPLERRT
jgi:PAS domain S-box-containing protein